MRWADTFRVGAHGLRARPLRAVLSAVGIAIGIAAMVAVVGISASSQELLNQKLDRLGTNLLTVAPGQSLFGDASQLPLSAEEMIGAIGPVTSLSATGMLADTAVYRNDRVDPGRTNSIGVRAARLNLLDVVGGSVESGHWLDPATAGYPTVVLGAKTAERLGIGAADARVQVWLGGQWFTVIGILDPVELAPELDASALVGWPAAESYLDFDAHATTVYTRAEESAIADVQAVLGATAYPEHPEEVDVSRPSDALAAKAATDEAFTGLLLGLGAVALVVGGVGVANTMVISVLERRGEIGLRRSIGATRGDVRAQFLMESALLSLLGGAGGVVLGAAVTASYALWKDWPVAIPAWVLLGGFAATVLIGAVAGWYPAAKAARLSPTEALAVP
ncbi:ABC transporter permease [Phytomonospora sp. NPDC050363]|uniref:ABC transporter permease n=1 Tax=Phytomonospora sp. NPDC050363 TaxID=3155642 RepID=UPI0033C1BFB4